MNINKRLEQLECSSKYGAPMGRMQTCENDQASVYVQRVEFVDGDYDRGGAYWGGGGTPLWCAMDEEGDVCLFCRAQDRSGAIDWLATEYPDIKVLDQDDIDVDEFTRHYVIAALWSSTTGEDCEPLDENHTIDDIAPDTYAKMRADCEKFINENRDDLLTWDGSRYSVEEMGGHDFWLTRNGHGSGFWDGDWDKKVGKRLTESCRKFGEVWIDVGDDGKIYQ